MRSEVSEISSVQVELRVEVPWERVQKDLDASFRKVAQQAKLKGFRPGKVPPAVVRKVFGRQVKGEVAATLVEEGLLAAVQEHALEIVARPEVDAPEVADGEPLVFRARVEVRPKVDRVVLDDLVLWKRPIDVPSAAIDEEVEQLRRQHAAVRVPEPMRPARAGDRLTLDYTVTLDGQPVPDMAATDRPADLGEGSLLPEFETGLLGLVPGERKTIEVDFGEDHANPALRGKRAAFEVQVKELQERLLPEVDDELAKDVGDFETLLELRLDIRKRLEKLAEAEVTAGLREQLIDRLVEKNPVEVPPSLVRQQQQQILRDVLQLGRFGGGLPNAEALFRGLEGRAERRVRAAIVLGALARQEGLAVTPADLEAHFAGLAAQSGKHVAKVRAEYQGERGEQLESQLLEAKLMDYLMSRATIRDGEPPSAATDAAEPTSGPAAEASAPPAEAPAEAPADAEEQP